MPDIREILDDPRRACRLSSAEAAALLVELASLQAAVAARLTPPATETATASGSDADRLLTAEDVAERLQRSVDWVYRHAKHWPFTRRLTRRTLRFSEAGLQRFIAGHRQVGHGLR